MLIWMFRVHRILATNGGLIKCVDIHTGNVRYFRYDLADCRVTKDGEYILPERIQPWTLKIGSQRQLALPSPSVG